MTTCLSSADISWQDGDINPDLQLNPFYMVPPVAPSFQKGASGQHVKCRLKFLNHRLNRKSSNLPVNINGEIKIIYMNYRGTDILIRQKTPPT